MINLKKRRSETRGQGDLKKKRKKRSLKKRTKVNEISTGLIKGQIRKDHTLIQTLM